jgi:hypothetical protein
MKILKPFLNNSKKLGFLELLVPKQKNDGCNFFEIVGGEH